MTHIRSIFSEEDEKKALDDGLIRIQTHPTLDYYIYCYTKIAQYDPDSWKNPAVLHSRGLIVDSGGDVIARPWKKFFNYGQEGAPSFGLEYADFVAMDKVDGSMGTLFYNPESERFEIATKGSFTSDQAIHATEVWNRKYGTEPNLVTDLHVLGPNLTFLFEIVYPASRVVLDYEGMDDLVLLGAVSNQSGTAVSASYAKSLIDWWGPVAQEFEFKTLRGMLEAEPRPNAEGYVFLDQYAGEMFKVKQEDYLRLHKAISNLSPRSVWERLLEGETEAEIVGSYPDEFEAQVREYLDKIKTDYDELCFQIGVTYESIKHIEEQKDFAAEALKFHYQGELFMLRQGRSIHESVMKKIYPDAVDKK